MNVETKFTSMIVRVVLAMAALSLIAACQTAEHPRTTPGVTGFATVSGRKISNDNCGRLAIYVAEIDGKTLPNAITSAAMEKLHALDFGRHEIVFELRRSMGWSFAPFHAQVRVEFDVPDAVALTPEVELVGDDTRKKSRTEGSLWMSDGQTGKAASAKVAFSTEGYKAPTMIFIPIPTK